MYKIEKFRQFGLGDFNQPLGLKMNPENRWVKKVEFRKRLTDDILGEIDEMIIDYN